MIELRCPGCQILLQFEDDVRGKTVRCPDCHVPVTVTQEPGTSPPPTVRSAPGSTGSTQPEATYHWGSATRITLFVICGLFAVCLLPAWVAIAVDMVNSPGGGNGIMLIVMGIAAAFDLWWLLQAAACLRAGKLLVYHDRALLPRVPLAPFSLLPLPELVYRQVERFGLGT